MTPVTPNSSDFTYATLLILDLNEAMYPNFSFLVVEEIALVKVVKYYF